ncbi:nucleoside-triphosphatase [Aggregatilinea lenta]|uniref:nucleoside-triphosphatase n=1 Tax=Aggregatilinea lenta TaxID=913108 RepID=UPI000E5C16A3|nr:nucleoside-triphosphatase [Aggregatilinea lenta]
MRHAIAVLTGDVGSGKTTTCGQIVERAQANGLDCAGIVCPGRFERGEKVGIDLLDVRTGERRLLAEVDGQPAVLRTPRYRFHVETVAWGMACLDAARSCDVLIVDELGPLELERGQGWVNALEVLRVGQFDLAVVVVRPRLVTTFRAAMGSIPFHVFALPWSRQGNDLLTDLFALLV